MSMNCVLQNGHNKFYVMYLLLQHKRNLKNKQNKLHYLLFMYFTVCVNHSVVSDPLWLHGLQPPRLLCSWDSPGKNSGVGCHFLLLCHRPKSPLCSTCVSFLPLLFSLSPYCYLSLGCHVVESDSIAFSDWLPSLLIFMFLLCLLWLDSSFLLLFFALKNEESFWLPSIHMVPDSKGTQVPLLLRSSSYLLPFLGGNWY